MNMYIFHATAHIYYLLSFCHHINDITLLAFLPFSMHDVILHNAVINNAS
jgi:hypothetical protein